MMSLFASFDLYIFWLSLLYLTFLMVYFFLIELYKSFSFHSMLSLKIYKSFLAMFWNSKSYIPEFFVLYLVSLFLLIFFFNFFSVGPYSFPLTSQLSVVFILSLFSWFPPFIFLFTKNIKSFFVHLVPEGSPIFLVPLLVIIEFVSNIIRPLTLMTRLVANVVAGHVLMELYSSLGWKSLFFFVAFPLLVIVEMLVSIIQAYIFMTLSLLYISDLN